MQLKLNNHPIGKMVYGRPYEHVTNMKSMLHRKKKKQKKNEPSAVKCNCKHDKKRCDRTCSNALECRSCTRGSCSWNCNNNCNNSHTENQIMGLKITDSRNNTGKGLTSIKNLNQGDFVVNYIGELYHSKDPKWKRR